MQSFNRLQINGYTYTDQPDLPAGDLRATRTVNGGSPAAAGAKPVAQSVPTHAYYVRVSTLFDGNRFTLTTT